MCGCTCCASPCFTAQTSRRRSIAARRNPGPASPQKQRLRIDAREGRPGREPCAYRCACCRPDGHDPLLRALAPDAHFAAIEIDAIEIDARELGEPQPRRIGELEERAIAQRKGIGTFDLDEPDGVIG